MDEQPDIIDFRVRPQENNEEKERFIYCWQQYQSDNDTGPTLCSQQEALYVLDT